MIAKQRVLHISPALFGPDGGIFGGAERYSFELARHMAEFTPTRLVSFGDKESCQSVDSLDIRIHGPAWRVRGQRFNQIHPALIRDITWANVVHCHQQHLLVSSLTAFFCRLSRRRVFATELGGGGWDISAYVSTDAWFHRHLHISRYSQTVAGHDGLGTCGVIYGGVDTELFAPDPAIAKEPLVVFVGRLLSHKGVNDLIAALPEGLDLEIIGRPYDARFQADLRRLAEGKRVRFRTDCSDADIVAAYQRALCVVLPSVYRDCYGNESRVPELLGQTLIEGMACGTAAICTDVASMPEVVENGVTGFVVPPNDPGAMRAKLLWLRDHPDEARAMGEAGRRRVLESFTWPAVVANCLKMYAADVDPALQKQ